MYAHGLPDAEIIGIDYSNRSTGLHWPDFNDVRVQPPWAETDLQAYAAQVRQELRGLGNATFWFMWADAAGSFRFPG